MSKSLADYFKHYGSKKCYVITGGEIKRMTRKEILVCENPSVAVLLELRAYLSE